MSPSSRLLMPPSQAFEKLAGCPCGHAHETESWVRKYIEDTVAKRGVTVVVSTPEGQWRVPRLFIAMHGLKADDLPQLAATYNFEAVEHAS